MDILKKSLAPITKEAWEAIEEQTRDVFKTNLTARKIVDIDGPKGIDYGAVSTGKLIIPESQPNNLSYGINQVQPLIETRNLFSLNIWELDNASRGAVDINLDNLIEAAKKMAEFEEKVIYYGLKEAGIHGIVNSSENTIKKPQDLEDLPRIIAEALDIFKINGIEGPFSLIINPKDWNDFFDSSRGYPLNQRVGEMISGQFILAPYVSDMLLVSKRGGDMRMTIGQDLSIGYNSHDTKNVELFLTESFTFQVYEPNSFIVIN
ncbi:MAG: family 1 encapsulin nanocompartment shell protein [bacterium]